jgi:Cu(I)/Ag(I) efflux system protein CusF
MINVRYALLASVALLAISTIANAQPSGSAAPAADGPAATAATEFSEGEVRKVDKDSKKLTLKHGPLKNLDMPAMTMVFQVKEEAMLDKVQAGDKVRFQAEKVDGKFTVTRLEAAR